MQHPFLANVIPEIERLVVAAATTRGTVPNETGPHGLLVALSGGPDSVALLRAARIWSEAGERPLEAAHLNLSLIHI